MVCFIAAVLFAGQDAKPAALSHVWKVGDKAAYRVKGHLRTETRELGLETYLPDETWLQYDFFLDIVKNKADGIVEAKYRRPTMLVTEPIEAGLTKTETEKINMTADITLSPINELLSVKDTSPKKPGDNLNFRRHFRIHGVNGNAADIMDSLMADVYRLSLFMGSLDSALDFQPKLPFDEVKVGDTWSRTATYSPQKLDSKGGKTVMQRLDMVYTYKGLLEKDGKKFHRVSASLSLNADMTKFLKDNFPEDADEILNKIKEISYRLQADIDYDLDPQTCSVIKASSLAKGDFKLVVVESPDRPALEQKVTAETSLKPAPKN